MSNPRPVANEATPPAADRTNVFAILAIVTVWFTGILGLVFGYIALSQIKRTGERGAGMAKAAVVIGWIAVAIALAMVLMLVVAGGIYITRS
ncbi:MAG: DUF4190 domain-containing protein [Propionibacteriaceae bacterium]|nr:DUF4190 domain-containing protein [Propionibacteriaceae bacterium]